MANAHSTAEIERAVSKTREAITGFPDGTVSGVTIQFLLELYLGSLDNAKEANKTQQAKSATA